MNNAITAATQPNTNELANNNSNTNRTPIPLSQPPTALKPVPALEGQTNVPSAYIIGKVGSNFTLRTDVNIMGTNVLKGTVGLIKQSEHKVVFAVFAKPFHEIKWFAIEKKLVCFGKVYIQRAVIKAMKTYEDIGLDYDLEPAQQKIIDDFWRNKRKPWNVEDELKDDRPAKKRRVMDSAEESKNAQPSMPLHPIDANIRARNWRWDEKVRSVIFRRVCEENLLQFLPNIRGKIIKKILNELVAVDAAIYAPLTVSKVLDEVYKKQRLLTKLLMQDKNRKFDMESEKILSEHIKECGFVENGVKFNDKQSAAELNEKRKAVQELNKEKAILWTKNKKAKDEEMKKKQQAEKDFLLSGTLRNREWQRLAKNQNRKELANSKAKCIAFATRFWKGNEIINGVDWTRDEFMSIIWDINGEEHKLYDSLITLAANESIDLVLFELYVKKIFTELK